MTVESIHKVHQIKDIIEVSHGIAEDLRRGSTMSRRRFGNETANQISDLTLRALERIFRHAQIECDFSLEPIEEDDGAVRSIDLVCILRQT